MTAPDFHESSWRKSFYSQQNSECIEVAASAGYVGIRDSKTSDSPVLVVTRSTWTQLVHQASASQ